MIREIDDGIYGDFICKKCGKDGVWFGDSQRNPETTREWCFECIENELDRLEQIIDFSLQAIRCSNGHLKIPENVYTSPNGKEECRACKKARNDRNNALRVVRKLTQD